MTRYLKVSDLEGLITLVKLAISKKGADFYGWKNSPEVRDGALVHTSGFGSDTKTEKVSIEEALDIFKSKLDGAYGERFALTMATICGLVRQGRKVALLQIQKEEGTPFNAEGWLVVSIEGFPLFHIAPWDLPMAEVEKAGLVTLVKEGSEEAQVHAWKNTTKVDEFSSILDWMLG